MGRVGADKVKSVTNAAIIITDSAFFIVASVRTSAIITITVGFFSENIAFQAIHNYHCGQKIARRAKHMWEITWVMNQRIPSFIELFSVARYRKPSRPN